MNLRHFGAALLLAAAAVCPARLDGAEAPAPQNPAAPAGSALAPAPVTGRLGIVLMTVDSLRTDHVGAWGPGKPTGTPAIDLLAATGIRFDRAYTASVSTTPSAASILTGLVPSAHGLRDDLGGHLLPGVKTIADRLRAAGWATSAVIGTDRLDSVRGLAAGFDRYDDDITGIKKRVTGLSKERRASEVADRALVAFDHLPGDRPFFLWLHFHDPHYDYDPAEPQKSAWIASPYDGEVAAVDASIGAVTRNLRDRLPGGRLLLIVAGTHGEGLGDRKEAGHGFYLNEATTRVPLVMALGKPIREVEKVVTGPVSLLDVAPTVLEFAGLPAVEGLAGVSQAALLSAGAGAVAPGGGKEKRPAPRRIYVEAAAPEAAYGWSPLFSVTEGTRRVVQGERLETFDLLADPTAAAPLPAAPRWSKDLVAYGRGLFGTLEPPEARRRAIDAASAALNPPWAESPFCASRDDRPDPRDPLRLELQEPLFYTRMDWEIKMLGRAMKRGYEILEKDPANPTALEAIIFLAIRNRWSDQQILEPLEVLTCQYPYRSRGYHWLGHYYSNKKEWEQAVKAFAVMALADPDDEEADYDLACTYAAMGRKDEAFEHLTRSIAKGSDNFDLIRGDGRLRNLRDDPRFAILVPQNPK